MYKLWLTSYYTSGAPFVLSSSTVVVNLNADLLDGNHASAFALSSHTHSYAPLTGTGTSGSWPISITGSSTSCTGNAATATTVTTNIENVTVKSLTSYGVGANSGIAGAHYTWGYQETGPWTSPYPDLVIGYHVGMKFGANVGYGGMRFYNDHPFISSTELFSIGNGDSNVRVANSIYSQVYYDSNNTGYYCDPASTSNFNLLNIAGYAAVYNTGTWGISISGNAETLDGYHGSNYIGYNGGSYYQVNTWLQCNGSYGLYWPSTNGAHLEANTLSSYGSIAIRGSRNGWRGIHFYDGGYTPHLMIDGAGNGGLYYESGGRWANYYSYANDCTGFGTSSTSSAYNIYASKGIYSGGRVDGTIFYDSNNTGYYCDPASTSNLFDVYFNAMWGNKVYIHQDPSIPEPSSYQTGGNYYGEALRVAAQFDGANNSSALLTRGIDGGQNLDVQISTKYNSGYYYLVGAKNGATKFYVNLDGACYAASYNNLSDMRAKTNIDYSNSALDLIENIIVRKFDWIESNKHQSYGVIAQELQTIFPECVFAGMGPDEMMSVNYTNMIPMLIKACQEQQIQIEDLELEISNLKNQIPSV